MAKKYAESPIVFEDFMIDKIDKLDVDTLEFCKKISGEDGIDYDAWIIDPILENAVEVLNENGIDTCYPYLEEDDIPCYSTGTCKCKVCKYEEALNNGKHQFDSKEA